MKCGLLGRSLKHSYSKIIHAKLGGYDYDLYEIEPYALKDFVKEKSLSCYNVTIPYKTDIMPFLDDIDDKARDIGAVNTVVDKNGYLYGYNTDYYGMTYMILSSGVSIQNLSVMILGNGATSKTARSVCRDLGAKDIIIVSRTGEVNYQNCYLYCPDIILNTTPVGTYPNSLESPIDLEKFNGVKAVFDVVYNPLKTALTFSAEKLNIKAVNGLKMLVAQAKYARDLFLGSEKISPNYPDKLIEKITAEIVKETQNIVLIGMPGSGKSTVGRELAKRLNKKFIDIDAEIELSAGLEISEIFSKYGEDKFREIESQVVKKLSNERNAVIATGGGVIKRKENEMPLKLNGVVVWIKRDLELLSTFNRPLSKTVGVENLYKERKDLYESFSQITVSNNKKCLDAVKEIIEKCEY